MCRVADGKEQIRHLVGACVAILPQVLEPEAVMQGFAASLHYARAPKVLCAIMDAFAAATRAASAGAYTGRRHPVLSSGGRSALASCIALATHKNPDVRQSALAGIAAAYTEGSPSLVEASIAGLPTSPQAAVSRALAQTLGPLQYRSPTPLVHRRAASGSPELPRQSSCVQAPMSPSPSPAPTSSALRRRDLFSPDVSSSSSGEFDTHRTPVTLRSPAQVDSLPRHPSATLSVDATWQAQSSLDEVHMMEVDDDAAALSPRSPPAQQLSLSLAGLATAPTVAGMHRAAQLAPQMGAEDLAASFETVCRGLMLALASDDFHEDTLRLQEACLDAFLELLPLVPVLSVSPLAVPLLERMLRAAGAVDDEAVASAAERAARELLAAIDAVDALSAMVPHLPAADARPPFEGEKGRRAAVLLRVLRPATAKVSEGQLSAGLPLLMPSLCTCYNSPNAEIRRASVNCIVSIHQVSIRGEGGGGVAR